MKNYKLTVTILILIIITFVCGLAVVLVENRSSLPVNLKTYEDGLWWAVTTVTGVGYGDLYPLSSLGRLIGAFLEIVGVLVFGLVIALITIKFFRTEQLFYWRRETERFDLLDEKIKRIEQKLDYFIAASSEVEAQRLKSYRPVRLWQKQK